MGCTGGIIAGASFMYFHWRAKYRKIVQQNNAHIIEYIEFALENSVARFKYSNLVGCVKYLLEHHREAGGIGKKFQAALNWHMYMWLRKQSDCQSIITTCDRKELSPEKQGTTRYEAAQMITTALSDGPAKGELIRLFSKILPGKTETHVEDFLEYLRNPFFSEAKLYEHFVEEVNSIKIKDLEPFS